MAAKTLNGLLWNKREGKECDLTLNHIALILLAKAWQTSDSSTAEKSP